MPSAFSSYHAITEPRQETLNDVQINILAVKRNSNRYEPSLASAMAITVAPIKQVEMPQILLPNVRAVFRKTGMTGEEFTTFAVRS